MSDLIRREDAIDALVNLTCYGVEEIENLCNASVADSEGWLGGIRDAVTELESLPSAEPERKKGEWIEISWSEPDPNVCCTSYSIQSAKCSICGKYHTTPYLHSLVYFPYCPNCGAEMRSDQ